MTHISPECWANIDRPLAETDDVYAFAIVLWENATGKSPFSGRCGNNTLYMIENDMHSVK